MEIQIAEMLNYIDDTVIAYAIAFIASAEKLIYVVLKTVKDIKTTYREFFPKKED